VARSSIGSGYKALAGATSKIVWLMSLLQELGLSNLPLPTMWYDNLGATYLAANPVLYARMRHIEIDFHFVRELVHRKFLIIQFTFTSDHMADISQNL
jgi:hypothetical protein